MPSSAARQRNKRALATTGSASKVPRTSSGSGSPASPSRLRNLLSILLLTTVVLVGLQGVRLYFRGPAAALKPLSEWTKAKYENPDRGATAFNKLAPEGAVTGAPALVPGETVLDHDEFVKPEGQIEVQFDEDGNMDLATAQRMLDLLYRPARDGVKAAGKVASAMVDDEIAQDAADTTELEDDVDL